MTGALRAAARRWRNEGGLEMVETVAVIGVAIALLVAAMTIFGVNGGSVGSAAIGRLSTFISNGQVASGQNPFGASASRQVATQGQPMALPVYQSALGVPGAFSGQAQVQPAQASNFIATWWNSLPIGVQGAIIAALGAVVVGLVFVGLVALGVLTFVSLPVAAVIAVVGVVVAAVAGAIWAIVTGKVDVVQLLLLGAVVQLAVIGTVWVVFSGAGAAALAWVRTAAWPWVTRTVGGLVRGAGRLATRFFGWVRNTAAPAVWRGITAPFRFAARQATRLWSWIRTTAWPAVTNWVKTVAWPWIKDGPKWLANWVKKNPLWAAAIYRVIEELFKGSYTEGVVFLVIVSVVSVFWKNPIVLIVFATIKGLYSRYKEDIHKRFPWLPKLP